MSAKVLVGLSGGVDSAVAAALLKQQGYEVIGLTLKLIEYATEDSQGCCTANDIVDAARVCDILGIEHMILSRKKTFHANVVQPYIDGHREGVVSNPCITCNSTVKLPSLFEVADHLGIQYVATGHYAKIENGKLRMADDISKDQSYFLWEATSEQLERLIFPLGHMTKTETRALAESFGLKRVAVKKDSTNLCFLEGKSKQEFMEKHEIGTQAGNIVDSTGTILGKHSGYSTVVPGQRASVSIDGKPRYVLNVLPQTNEVIVGTKEEAVSNTVKIHSARWTAEVLNKPLYSISRYGQKTDPALTTILNESDDGNWTVQFDTAIHGLTPGQSVVFYQDGYVVGGGIIAV